MTNEQKLEIVKKALEKGATIRVYLYDDKTRQDADKTIQEICGCRGEYGRGKEASWIEVEEGNFYVTSFFDEEKPLLEQGQIGK